MLYSCLVYGLGLEYNLPIAGLRSLSRPARIDVRLILGLMPPDVDAESDLPGAELYVSPNLNIRGESNLKVWPVLDGRYFRFRYADGTVIVVMADGSAVWATWPQSTTLEDTATYLLGPTLGFVLRLRGKTCLHASAVAIGNEAIALLGPSGFGKSSLAAAFAGLGNAVLSDDVVVLQDHGEEFEVLPAYPRIRLWPDSVAGLFGKQEALPRLTPNWDKRFLELESRFQQQPLRLSAIYVLGERRPSGPGIEPVAPAAALMELISNTYTSYLLDRNQRAAEFELLARLVQNVPLWRLSPRDSFAALSQTCQAVVDHFELNVRAFRATTAVATT